MTYRILVTGTREKLTPRSEREIIYALRVAAAGRTDILVVHGACPTGVDAFVDGLCYELGVDVERHRADWAAHGRAAGPRRNAHMISLGADICLAFPHGASRGTRGCAMLAERAGIPTTVVEL